MSPKEMMPGVLSDHFKDRWRLWSYKARDYLSISDETLNAKLEAIETKAAPLTDDYIASLNISESTNAAIKRLLVHKLEGEPAEVVRSVSRKHGLEQYRTLAQLCDPAAGGRDWADVQKLYHPSASTNLQSVPARIAEWNPSNCGAEKEQGRPCPRVSEI